MGLKQILFGKINRKFLVMGFLFIILIIVVGFILSYFQNQEFDREFKAQIFESEEDFIDLENQGIRALSSALEVILQDEYLKEIYLEKDRDKLYNQALPLFQELKFNQDITHFYFHLPNGENFLRVHNKDIFGDQVTRFTFEKAKDTENIGAGIELGKTAFALRVVKPYYQGKELIGYVELGQEIDSFLENLKRGKNNEFVVIVEKRHLDKEDWASVRRSVSLRNNWEDLEDHVFISGTTQLNLPCFRTENVDKILESEEVLEDEVIEEIPFICGGFPIIDAGDREVGAIFAVIDTTPIDFFLQRMRYVFIVLSLLLILGLIGIGFFITKKITKPITKLNYAATEIQKKDFKVRTNIKTGDELQQLGETFNETAKVLQNMDNEYKRLEKAKTEFLSITSHELRSPMTPMRGQLEMLMQGYFGKLNPKQKKAVDIVLRNSYKLDNILRDLLEVSRIEAGRLKFRFVKSNLTNHTNEVINEMKDFMPEKKIKIIGDFEKLPVIKVDPDKIMQILRILISNAIKFSPENTKIIVGTKLSNGQILFNVKDEGIGIKPQDQKRVFEPFFQAEQTMYRKHGGTGLGLTIVKGLVETQGGKIWLKSEVGKGTTFYFTVLLKPIKKIKPIRLVVSSKPKKI